MDECKNPKNYNETKLSLEDIRKKINDIKEPNDRDIVLDLLNHVTDLNEHVAQQTDIIATLKADKDTLVEVNNKLFSKVSDFISPDDPLKSTDYNDIDRSKSNIVDDILSKY